MAEDQHNPECTSNFQENCCVICKLSFEDEKPITVLKKGILTLIKYSELRGRLELGSFLTECISVAPIRTVLVHKKCRRDFTDQKRRAETNVEETEVPKAKRLCSSFSPFNWNAHCMLCGKSATIDTRHPNRTHMKTVTTLPLRSKILEQCHKRGDLWASEVQTRLHGCIDLVAAEAVYHSKCFSRFMLNKESHQVSAGSDNKAQGRPEDHNMLICYVSGLNQKLEQKHTRLQNYRIR